MVMENKPRTAGDRRSVEIVSIAFTDLVHISELWVSVAKIPNLIRAKAVEAVIALAEIALSVLPLAVSNTTAR